MRLCSGGRFGGAGGVENEDFASSYDAREEKSFVLVDTTKKKKAAAPYRRMVQVCGCPSHTPLCTPTPIHQMSVGRNPDW